MTLYSLNGSYPVDLTGKTITLSNGATRNDVAWDRLTPEEIADAGYVPAPPEPAYDPATQQLGWDGEGWTVEELPPPEPEPAPTRAPSIVAQARLHIDGFDVSGINGNSEIASASVFDVGMIYCEFRDPLEWADYIVTTGTESGHHAFVSVDNQAPEGFILCTQTAAGESSLPAWIQLVVSR